MKTFINFIGIKNIWIIAGCCLLLQPGCKPTSEQEGEAKNQPDSTITVSESRKVSAEQAYEMMTADTSLVVLDVRTPEEFEAGHISHAINIDFRNDDFKENVQKLDKEKKYMLYCMGGHRSNQAQLMMDSLKFRQVYDLMGGFKDWSKEGLPQQQAK